MENKIVINNNCWVAYCDLLGFKKQILGFEQQSGVGHLDAFSNNFYKAIKKEGKILLNQNYSFPKFIVVPVLKRESRKRNIKL